MVAYLGITVPVVGVGEIATAYLADARRATALAVLVLVLSAAAALLTTAGTPPHASA